MRKAFANKITELAKKDKRIIVLSGDIGNKMFDNLKQDCPNQFYNTGVAEQSATGIAAGLATCGLRPFIYSIAPFVILRPFEFIKVDLCYHNLPVTIVGVGAGASYQSLGHTHESLNDIAIMKTLPNLTIYAPGDAKEVESVIDESLNINGPVYIRLGKVGEPIVHKNVPSVVTGKLTLIKSGNQICIIGIGNMLPIAVEVAEKLNATVFSATSIKPFYDINLLNSYDKIAIIEEHSEVGGFGSTIMEIAYKNRINLLDRLWLFNSKDEFIKTYVDQQMFRKINGLTVDNIYQILK